MSEFANPFTPSFGGLPERFFGRQDLCGRVDRAFSNPSSPDRALFFTGPRGCGKTALLERLSAIARSERWQVVDVHSSNAVDSIAEQLIRGRLSVQVSAAPKATLPGGVDVSLVASGEGSVATRRGLIELLVERAAALATHRGVFISIDEIQKIPEGDMEEVCAAVQMARRKGLPVVLVLAGLPGSKEHVASFRGCTFMQRVEDVRIGSLRVSETIDAYRQMLMLTPDIVADDQVVLSLAAASQGYPYLVQLVGYHFVEYVREAYPVGDRVVQEQDVDAVEDDVYATYRQNVLVPSMKGLGRESRAYLRTLARVMDAEGIALTADIARELGKEQRQLSVTRQGLIDRRLVLPVERGRICYGLPYLTRYSQEEAQTPIFDRTDAWIPR